MHVYHRSCPVEVRADGVTLKDSTVIPCGLVVWSTGLAPRYFTRGTEVPKNERGQVSKLDFHVEDVSMIDNRISC